MKKLILIVVMGIFFVSYSWSQNIVAAEYFFDSDPGVGLTGNTLPITANSSIDETFVIPTTGLSEGLHVLHIRAQDTNGTWSLYERRYFFINANSQYQNPPEYNIVEAEYFFDTDTGIGNAGNGNIGGSLPVTSGLTIDESFTIPTTGLSQGLHVLHIRAKDENGTWSLYERQYFFINANSQYQNPPEYNIVEAEYFFDSDTGVGNAGSGNIGGSLPVTSGLTIDESLIISTAGLSDGLHVLHIRAKDNNGTWSLYDRKYFFINTPSQFENPPEYDIVEAEYFFNTDPGVGNGNSLSVSTGNSIDELFTIDTSSLGEGVHVLHIRTKDANGTWSLYERKYFGILAPYSTPDAVNIIEAEYFVINNTGSDIDPGVGNGTPIAITPGMSIDETLVIPVECLEPSQTIDDYTLHVRVKDENGTWSLYEYDVFTVEEDMVPPTTICQDFTLELDVTGNASLTAIDVDNGSNDACGIKSLVIDKTAFTCADLGTNSVILTVTDNNDNVATCVAIVTVVDTTAPIVTTQDIVVELDENGNANIAEDAIENGSTDACGPLSFDTDKTNFNCSDLGNNTVTLTVTDGSGNEGFGNAIVTVLDVTPPNVITQNITIQLDENGAASITENAVDNGSSDACGPLTFNTDKTSFNCEDIGENTVTLVVTDGNSNAANATAIVTVEDKILPELTVVSDKIEDLDASCNFTIPDYTVETVATDNCGTATLSQTPTAGTVISGDGFVQLITLTADDGNGNSAQTTFNVTLDDKILPELTTVADKIEDLDASCNFTIPDYTGDTTATDNCGTATLSQTPTAGTVISGDGFVQLITLTADDGNGNSAQTTFNVTLDDKILPQLTPLSDKTEDLDASCNFTIPDYTGDTTATDNCGTATLSQTPTAGTVISGDGFVQLITLTADDGNENSAQTTFNVTLDDKILPELTTVSDKIEDLDANCNFTIPNYTGETTATDNCGTATLSQTPTAGTVISGDGFVQLITLTANDGNGNSAQTTFNVTLDDKILPELTVVSDKIEDLDANCNFTIPDYTGDTTATDNCGTATLSQTPTVGTVISGDGFVQLITLTADDGNGNSAQTTFNVTLDDKILPELTTVSDKIEDLDASCNFTIPDYTGETTATDNCGTATLSQTPTVGTIISGDGFVQLITLTADDGNGNSAQTTFNVTLDDKILPELTTVSDKIEDLDANCNFTIPDYTGETTATDNCGTATLSQTPTAGTVISGDGFVQLITLTADDGNGNSAQTTFNVTLDDKILPELTPVADKIEDLDASCNFTIPDYTGDTTATDNCGTATLSQTPTAGTIISGDGFVQLITLTADDGNGNSAQTTFNVTLDDKILPELTTVADKIEDLDANCNFTIPDYTGDTTATDNCGTATLSQTPTAGTVISGDGFVQLITLTTDDGNGNSAQTTFNVTLDDKILPELTTVADKIEDLDANCNFTIPDYTGDTTATDNCGTATLSQTPTAGTVISGDGFVQLITLTADDGNGNSAQTTFNVTLDDKILPELTTVADKIEDLDANCNFTIPDYTGDTTATDNCGTATLSQTPTAGTVISGDGFVQLITLTADDGNGNSAQTTFNVTLDDKILPELTTVADKIEDLDASCNFTIPDYTVETVATDNCGTATLSQTPTAGTVISGDGFVQLITLTTDDGNGNSAQTTFNVTLDDKILPELTTVADKIEDLDASCNFAIPDYTGDTTATDNCGTATLSQTPTAGTVISGDGFVQLITLTADDGNGNSAQTTFNVTLDDKILPELTTVADKIEDLDASCNFTIPDYTVETVATDNCGTATLSQTPTAGTIISGDGFVQLITLTADDGNGNSAQTTFNVTLQGSIITYYLDTDQDNFGVDDIATNIESCSNPGAGYSAISGDCDDNDPNNYPGNTEICDGQDNNCDGQIDEGVTATTYYLDTDQDTFGVDDITTNIESCTNPGTGYSTTSGDCDDSNNTIYPDAPELCDGLDNDCDGQIPLNEIDNDGDGISECQGDCDDNDPNNYPGNTEICDGQDNNCDGQIDEGVTATTYYLDTDQDTFGVDDITTNIESCTNPGTGYSTISGDCDDTNNTIYPDAPELCDGLDNDCDGQIPLNEIDNDGDGISECQGDCDDNDPNNYPGNTEICDGQDNNCDGQIDEGVTATTYYLDTDQDTFGVDDIATNIESCSNPGTGYSTISGDCDDTNNTIYPGAPELCDGLDNDCDGQIPLNEIDNDGDGISECQGDCDDNDPNNYPGNTEICDGQDNNCDGQIDEGVTATTYYLDTDQDTFGVDDITTNIESCSNPGTGYSTISGDCDDTNNTIYPGAPELCDGLDNDCDGQIPLNEIDNDGDGISECQGDCDDNDPNNYPGNTEICDGQDNNCDGQIDEGVTATTYYLDTDQDTFGVDDITTNIESCTNPGTGYSTISGDCDDTNNTIYPGAPELCDGLDNDCDGQIPLNEIDNDGDGISECQGDCDDNDPNNYPGNTEICDGQDNNCDGQIDEGVTATTYYLDTDQDTFGVDDIATNIESCSNPGTGYSTISGDCDDTNNTIYPGAPELCDGLDNDCDGQIPLNEIDNDGDGISECQGDCDDNDPNNYPGNTEICDGQDNNCDGQIDEGVTATTYYLDTDQDTFGVDDITTNIESCSNPGTGYSTISGDCDDTNNTIYPGAPELCDGLDNDCDGQIPLNEIDNDGDGISECQGDCDDNDPNNYPGNTEICDGQDNNCDGQIDEGVTATTYYLDTDQDTFGVDDIATNIESCTNPGTGYSAISGDCDDTNNTIYPDAPELCDGLDNDCDGQIPLSEIDNDGDGISECQGDCDDNDPNNYPGNTEICDGQDNNCDGQIDEGVTATTYYLDTDQDNFGVDDIATNIESCSNPGTGYSTISGDCDDTNNTIYPGAPELCDGLDNDCDGQIPLNEIDNDGDGISECQGDCDDNDPNNYPGNTEICDGQDNNCDGTIDEINLLICSIITSDTSCGVSNGNLEVDVLNGSGNYEFILFGGDLITPIVQNNNIFTGLSGGSYVVTVNDITSGACSTSCTGFIDEINNLTCNISATAANCGLADGSLNVTVNSGSGNFEYGLIGGNLSAPIVQINNPIFTGLASGSYSVTVVDLDSSTATDCSTTCSTFIDEINNLTCSIEANNSECELSDGSLVVTVNNGSGNFEYELTGGNLISPIIQINNPFFNGLPGGNYSVEVNDLNSSTNAFCTTTCNVVLLQTDSLAPTIDSCPSDQDIEYVLGLDASDPSNTGGFATASDVCDPNPTVSWSDELIPGNCFGNFTINRTWIATDNSGNQSTCVQVIEVIDTTPPTIVCPVNVTVESDIGLCTASDVNLGTPTLLDACSTVTYVNNAPLTYGFGDTIVTWIATDQFGNSAQCNQTVTVNKINTITSVTVNPESQQYSDLVDFEATIQSGDCPGAGGPAAIKVSFYVRNQKVGTADLNLIGGNLVGTLTAPLVELPTYPSNGQMAPGSAVVTAEFEGVNPNYDVVDATTNLTITQEDAIIDYNGHTVQATPNSSSSMATVTLSANIQDITVSNPDPDAGDIRNALVKFVNRDTDTDISGWIPVVNLIDPSDPTTGTVSYNWLVDIGNSTSESFTVGILVGTQDDNGYYLRNSSNDNTIVTVYKPVGDFITGGGYILPNESFGVYASTDGLKTNFGYNVKYNKKGKKLKGNMNIIFRRMEDDGIHTYQIKGNAIQSLGVNIADPDAKFGEFITKANLKDITDPENHISIAGNLLLKVEMTDRGEPGTDDSIGINLTNSSNTLLYSSNWLGNSTEEMLLSGGNLVVHSGFSLVRTFEVFEVNSWPNPSDTTFNIKLNSTNDELVDIVVFDINNKVIRRDRFNPKDIYVFGTELQSGLYFVQISQGSNMEIRRLIKY